VEGFALIKQKLPDGEKGISRKEWFWMVIGALATLLALIGLNRLTETLVETAQSKAELVAPPAPPPPKPKLSPPPPSVAVIAPTTERLPTPQEKAPPVGEMLRKHARENPDAADVLTEEQIKAVEEQGGPMM
jgi:hypothetical protein